VNDVFHFRVDPHDAHDHTLDVIEVARNERVRGAGATREKRAHQSLVAFRDREAMDDSAGLGVERFEGAGARLHGMLGFTESRIQGMHSRVPDGGSGGSESCCLGRTGDPRVDGW